MIHKLVLWVDLPWDQSCIFWPFWACSFPEIIDLLGLSEPVLSLWTLGLGSVMLFEDEENLPESQNLWRTSHTCPIMLLRASVIKTFQTLNFYWAIGGISIILSPVWRGQIRSIYTYTTTPTSHSSSMSRLFQTKLGLSMTAFFQTTIRRYPLKEPDPSYHFR